MSGEYTWTTEISCYETEGGKPFHLEISANSHLGSTHVQLDAVSVAELLSSIKKFSLGSIYDMLVEQAPIVVLHSSGKGKPLEKREEDLVIKALSG